MSRRGGLLGGGRARSPLRAARAAHRRKQEKQRRAEDCAPYRRTLVYPKVGSAHHRRATVRFWRECVARALHRSVPTPFYLFSAEPIRAALREFDRFERLLPIPVRHWFSCKTQPLAPLLRWWRRAGRPIEVVSEFELRAAIEEGFSPEQILVNGPAKDRWLPGVAQPGLRVIFDSRRELETLLPLAQRLEWSLGIRVRTTEECDPERPGCPTQFGFEFDAPVAALRRLRRVRARLEILHVHLRTNVAAPAAYERALAELGQLCRAAPFQPRYLDCGGGWPPAHTRSLAGRPFNVEFSLSALAGVYRRALGQFPGLRELWLENGRYLTARSGVLVLSVIEVKTRSGLRQLLCDGGRTLHALVSTWEDHEILTVPQRSGPRRLTGVYGPTCMAFDQLARHPLPRSLRPGDRLVWLEAGAYHLPWETRFSHGHAAVFWHDGKRLTLARPAQSFAGWWGQWSASARHRPGQTPGARRR